MGSDCGMNADELKKKAMDLPGVAEVMDAYSRAEGSIEQARPYLQLTRKKVVYTTSDASR